MTSSTAKTKSGTNETQPVDRALAEIRLAIEKLHPNGLADDDAGWQERKSAQTRIALLEAGVRCLAESGYARTTTQLVAASAKISRGAMLHHYTTKSDLIASVIDYIMARRMETFHNEITKLTEKQRVEEGRGIEIYWNSIQTKEYEAFLELSMASRTDEELRKVFDDKAKLFDALWFEQTPLLFPEWANQRPKKLALARDMVTATLEGLYLNRRMMAKRSRRMAVRNFLVEATKLIREGD